ncbi:hypothetical protein J7337_000027 [Fusarium musae]|uniref:Uncharacterized protein n=1 Tax=Fusarium musae TaxID=1042133 RepID=A0A9P8IV32_9HYPO|nr:hypothetical protein J7337_000027 [Fusarium musae]KAG9506495.1 hypothetical protein J7337_000027 [Fusarium musae]
MHSNILLAISILMAGSAVAGPCKPRTSASDALTVTLTTTEPTPTTIATETTIATSDSYKTTAIDYITTTTSEADSSTIAQTQTTTAASEHEHESTTASSVSSQPTTTGGITTTSEAESTTKAATTSTAVAAPTFSILAGSAPLTGDVLQADGYQGSYPKFNPSFNPLNPPYSPRTWVIEPGTDHIKDAASGNYLCAYYLFVQQNGGAASISTCNDDRNPGLNSMYGYLSCQIVNGQLSCTAPKTVCTFDGDYTCVTSPGQESAYNQIVALASETSDAFIAIYETTPNNWTPMVLDVQEV